MLLEELADEHVIQLHGKADTLAAQEPPQGGMPLDSDAQEPTVTGDVKLDGITVIHLNPFNAGTPRQITKP